MPEFFNCFPNSSTFNNVSLARKLGSEFAGTFIMVFSAAAAAVVNQKYFLSQSLMPNAVSSGLAVMAVILSTGHISGAHINPAVTIAFAFLKHFPWAHVLPYITVQIAGTICASFVLYKGVFTDPAGGGLTVPTVGFGRAFLTEVIITLILMFIVTAVSTDTRAVGELAALAVGGTVVLNTLVAGPTTGASMNPVRSLGPAIALGNYHGLWVYLVAPPIGALLGAAVYTAIKIPASNKRPNQQIGDSEFSGPDASSTDQEPLLGVDAI
ncbi:hypothetical protein UlMin_036602 [Ulmus minor]